MMQETWKCSVQDLARATNGQIMSTVFNEFEKVGTDTRDPLNKTLFVPLKGGNHDAHDFIPKALEQGARVILVHEWRAEWKPLLGKATFVRVENTLLALQEFARFWRKKMGFKVLAITGSNGKTSTKEFTLSLVKEHIPTFASRGSYNNHWGVPLSILQAGSQTKVLILEMGMNKSGELTRLCQIAEPDVVVVTTVGRAHVGELGSMANVAAAKEEIYQAAPRALHIFNMDNEWTLRMQAHSHGQQIKYSSFNTEVDVYLRAQSLSWEGIDICGSIRGVPGQTWVHVLGRQNTVNLMCASSLALAAGLTPEQIWHGLGVIQDVAWGRNQRLRLQNGARVIFDAYNANPDSMHALFKNLYEIEMHGRKFLIVGDMKELGSFTDQAHEEIGERAGSVGFEGVLYVGKNADAFLRGLEKAGKPKLFLHSVTADAGISREFLQRFKPDDLVAIKGSRSMQLERVMEGWPLQTPLGEKP